MRTLKLSCELSAARDGLLRFAQPMATLRSPSPQRPSGSTSWIFWEHSDEMTGNILARQRHPRLGTSADEAIRIPILIVALQDMMNWTMLEAQQLNAEHLIHGENEAPRFLRAESRVQRALGISTRCVQVDVSDLAQTG